MSDLARWARLWLSLPADERRARTGRVVDRLLRRSRRVRALGLARATPSWRSFEAALDVSLEELDERLARSAPERGPLWRSDAPSGDAVSGSRPSAKIDWHGDPMSGVRWDPKTYFTDVETVRLDGSDVRVVWELSRFQHLLPMGRGRSREAAAQVLSWIAANPPGLGVNWASPMEVALRATSWTAALAFFRGLPGWEPPIVRLIARSLWAHGRHVRRNLEVAADVPATNHYLANLLGLLSIARMLPELREARPWGEMARAELVREIERQVEPDGVSFERSLAYHGFAAEIFIHAALLERAAGRPMPDAFVSRLAAMLEATAWSLRPDGTIPAWGDGDDGRVLTFSSGGTTTLADQRRLLALGGRLVGRPDLAALGADEDLDARCFLGPPEAAAAAEPYAPWTATCGRRFERSGWHVLRAGDVHVGVAAGPVGTRGLGSHTHNDLFAPSFWAAGREWIVDPGTGSYSRDPSRRNRLRGVAAHAALQLGTREPNELAPGRDGLFRVVERAHPEVVAWEATRERASLTARHTGYSGPEGAWTWERTLALDAASAVLSAVDRLEASEATDVAAAPREAWLRFPLAPGLEVRIEEGPGPHARFDVVVTDREGRALRLALEAPEGSELRLEPCEVSPRYGDVVASSAIVVRLPVATTVEAAWTLRVEGSAS